jgi:hypothetical protein
MKPLLNNRLQMSLLLIFISIAAIHAATLEETFISMGISPLKAGTKTRYILKPKSG